MTFVPFCCNVKSNRSGMENKLYIDINTKKGELLSQLASRVRTPEATIYLVINSVPSFLNTPVAIAIFNKQISNYPKPIFWFSSNPLIQNFLKRCNIRIKDPNLFKDSNDAQTQKIQYDKQVRLVSSTAITISKPHQKLQSTPENSNIIVKTNSVSKLLNYREAIKNYQDKLFRKVDQKQFFEEEFINNENLQDFNSLIQKLEQTKSKLKEAKNLTQKTESQPVLSSVIKTSPKKSLFKSLNQVRLSIFTFLIFLAALLTFVNTFFPTKVYTLELEPTQIQDKIQLVLSQDSFNLEKQNIIVENTQPTTGSNGARKQFAAGTIKITNTSTNSISLTNGGLKFKNGDFSYTQIFDPKLPPIIKLENANSDVDVKVQADSAGPASNAGGLTNFVLVNLNGDQICSTSSCKAFASSVISVDDQAKSNIVTESDLSSLEQVNNKDLSTKINDYVAKIKVSNPNRVIQNSWYKTGQISQKYDHATNDSAQALTLNTIAQVTFYDLSRNNLLDLLRIQIGESVVVKDINIEGENLDFDPDKGTVKLTINYKGNKYLELPDQEIANIFRQNPNLENVTHDLQNKYPNLGKIVVKQNGLNIPGLNPKVKVDVVKQ